MDVGYAKKRKESAEKSRQGSLKGRDIGQIPPVGNPSRRADASGSFRRFCECYFPHRFALAWSKDHLAAIACMESVAVSGGQHALAMPRGSGKTTLAECLCLWATFTGRHPFVLLMGAGKPHATGMLDAIKDELEENETLAEDFPEVCYPISCLEGINHRAPGQLYQGERTKMAFTKEEVRLPTIPGSPSSGACFRVSGLTGGFRGLKKRSVRPSLVILDDPQTDTSARSESQCDKRERIIAGAVMGLAGPGKKISAIMPCTVIRKGDLADRFLDRERSPLWNGQRFKMVYAMPKDMGLWEDYAQQRQDEIRNGGKGSQATEFYRTNRTAMDDGAVIAWPENFKDDELSAIQSAMNLFFKSRVVFDSEYQNEPSEESIGDGEQLSIDKIAARCNGLGRGIVPLSASKVTAFIDVQQRLLYWLVAAWANDFTGAVIDYGCWPDQGRRYWHLSDAQRTLGRAAPGAGLEGAIYNGLDKLTGELLGREFRNEGGTAMRIEKLLIDAAWGASTDTVKTFCRRSPHSALLMPTIGRGLGAASKPMSEYTVPAGSPDKLGFHWFYTSQAKKSGARHLLVDTNFWKSFVAERLLQGQHDRGALTLYSGHDHRMIAEHCCAEYRVRTEGRGRTLDEWRLRVERPDNHFWDCLVGSAVAASFMGSKMMAQQDEPKPRKRVRWSEVYAAKHGAKTA